MNPFKTKFKDQKLVVGWTLLAISSILFCLPLIWQLESADDALFFMPHFAIAIFYFILSRFFPNRWHEENRMHYRNITLVLALISAYALNREMDVFSDSADWFAALLVLICLNFLSTVFFEAFPNWLRVLSFFIQGVGIVVFIYLSLYLFPLYFISLFGLIALGISIHTYVPLFMVIQSINGVKKLSSGNKKLWYGFGAGIVSTITACVIFAMMWNQSVDKINRLYASSLTETDGQLPVWVRVAQGIPSGGITEKVLKNELIFKAGNWSENIFLEMPRMNFTASRQVHDPLVLISGLFSSQVLLSEKERIKVLESQYNARHETLERLWSGENLKTERIASHIRVWPQMHMAYTEKIITVCNKGRRGLPEEGVYTFYLPEGAVITSLSLWIEGREEKGILTTKEKANTAYRTIVGYERRDPSVVHWQEGNTVSVRVFPVNTIECRTFRIGISAPLRKTEGQLAYDNIWFEGPSAASATETIKIEMVSDPGSFIRQASFSSSGKQAFTAVRRYRPEWTVHFDDIGLKPHHFSFNGSRYSIMPYKKERVPVSITDVYLDVNRAWKTEEIRKVWKAVQGKRVWAYDNTMVQLNEENGLSILKSMQSRQFSLFPFHLIRNRDQAMVITKSTTYSPNLSDLDETLFGNRLKEKMKEGGRIRLFHLGNEFSPYIRSLKEFRRFHFECGRAELLEKLLEKQMFVQEEENDRRVIVHSADVAIVKTEGESASNAPDHLMRLFAYNQIMSRYGAAGLTRQEGDSSLVEMAKEAYVVSPVSSLVVLESQADYKRFDINETDGASLKNASMNNNGAVPEPGEWAIIILVSAVFMYFLWKWKSI